MAAFEPREEVIERTREIIDLEADYLFRQVEVGEDYKTDATRATALGGLLVTVSATMEHIEPPAAIKLPYQLAQLSFGALGVISFATAAQNWYKAWRIKEDIK